MNTLSRNTSINSLKCLPLALSMGQKILPRRNIVNRSLNSSGLFDKSLSSFKLHKENPIHNNSNKNENLEPSQDYLKHIYQTTNSLQKSIQSRRTISFFKTKNDGTENADILNEKMKEAVYRAIQCAITAPNHKRTEPFTFTILSSLGSKEKLSEICYNVTYQREIEKYLNDNKNDDQVKVQDEKDSISMKQRETIAKSKALKKMERWKNEIPIYLAVVVGGQPNQIATKDNDSSEDCNLYDILDLIPSVSIQQLEDYASTCAAIQNIQLSLNAEQEPKMGCKWATGPIIQTRAFRSLIRAKENELVVGLLMIGVPEEKHVNRLRARGRVFRRSFVDDFVRLL